VLSVSSSCQNEGEEGKQTLELRLWCHVSQEGKLFVGNSPDGGGGGATVTYKQAVVRRMQGSPEIQTKDKLTGASYAEGKK
jgi:hypothetical protein